MTIFKWFMKASFQWASIHETLKKCVYLVLEKLVNVNVGRFPRIRFTKIIFLETWCLAQIHILSVLSENQGNLTLHSDGTKKHGCSHTTYDIQTGENILVVGMIEIRGADVKSQLDRFQEIVDDIG